MGAYTLLQDLTVATNSTSVVLNDFGTITKDDFIKVVANFSNATASDVNIEMFVNTATTTTNYHRQLLQGSGSTVTAFRSNAARFTTIVASGKSTTFGYLKLSENDRANWFTNRTNDDGSNIETVFQYTTSSGATFTSGIDTLTFTGATNSIGTGSRIQIYKLDAVKVADFTVATNSTQVNIPFPTGTFSPAIDKDSEYLLVSDVKASTGMNLGLFVNDNTTAGDYYVQFIRGDGGSATAGRVNSAIISSTQANVSSIIYSHIKLSNIGAYTSQSYEIENSGLSSVRLTNWFLSSEAENITSITKLNLVGQIASGSRFTLYKLYE